MIDRGTFVEVVSDWLDGEAIRRLMFCFRARGCAHAFRGKGPCRMCAFPDSSNQDRPVSEEELVAQFENMMADVDLAGEGIHQVDLFCAGSFFNDEEIPPAVRGHVLGRLGALPAVRRVLVETRPEYLTGERVDAALAALGNGAQLEVALGLESADDRVREEIIRKGFGREDFEGALRVLATRPVAALVYLLVKPPTLSEGEALADAVASGRWVFERAAAHGVTVTAAFQPVFVQKGTWVDELHREGRYRPPWLWTVIEVLRRLHGLGELQVGSASDEPPPYAVRGNCGLCDARCEAAIEAYNRSQDRAALDVEPCPCREEWIREIGDEAGK